MASPQSDSLAVLVAAEPDERECLRRVLQTSNFRSQVAGLLDDPDFAALVGGYEHLAAIATRRPLLTAEIINPARGLVIIGVDHVTENALHEYGAVGTERTWPAFSDAMGLMGSWPAEGREAI